MIVTELPLLVIAMALLPAAKVTVGVPEPPVTVSVMVVRWPGAHDTEAALGVAVSGASTGSVAPSQAWMRLIDWRLVDYGVGAQILVDLGVKNMILLTNASKVVVGLEGFDLHIVEQRPIR